MMVKHAKHKYSEGVSTVYNLVGDCSGSVSGGTIASALLMTALPKEELHRLASDSYFLASASG